MFVENKLYGLKTIIDDYSLFLYQSIYPYMKNGTILTVLNLFLINEVLY